MKHMIFLFLVQLLYQGSTAGDSEPAFLTPYIENGDFDGARNLATVTLDDFPDLKSFSGFFTVDKQYNSSQFFWYFPSEKNKDKAPVIIWLQGGRGISSLDGLFDEHGPLEFVAKHRTTILRQYSWAKFSHMVYIDNPIGVGFSFTDDEKGYATELTQVADQLYNTLTQFFQVFPDLQQNPLVIASEYNAAKYAVALADVIDQRNSAAQVKMTLKALAMGNAWVDPTTQVGFQDFLSNIGLIDLNLVSTFDGYTNNIQKLIASGDWLKAMAATNDYYRHFYNLCKSVPHTNYVYGYRRLNKTVTYEVVLGQFRDAIHVGKLTFNKENLQVFQKLEGEFMKSVKPQLIKLLAKYHVMLYTGHLDIIVPYRSVVNFVNNMDFDGKDIYQKMDRVVMTPSDVDAPVGYCKGGKNLVEIMVRSAGGLVARDQPRNMYLLMNQFADLIAKGPTCDDYKKLKV